MKRIKKMLSIMLAMVMTLAMTSTVFATQQGTETAKGEGNFTITLKGAKTGHEYQAYQVFKADLLEKPGATTADDSNRVLSNIEWGDNVNQAGLIGKLKTNPTLLEKKVFDKLSDTSTARDVVEALQGQNDDNDVMQAFADVIAANLTGDAVGTCTESTANEEVVYKITGLKAGYYLVRDNTEAEDVDANDAYTRYIMRVAGDVESEVKSVIPDIDKKIVEGENLVSSNTAGIGKTVTFEIKGEVPNYTGYDKYFYVINDTLSKGLTFDPESVIVTVGDETLAKDNAQKGYYLYTKTTEPATDNNHTFEVAFANIMEYAAGQEIVVRYTATINSEAEIGATGNPNTANLIYSRDPNSTQNGEKDGKPGTPDEDVPKGEGPDHKTITYVAKIDITKYANEAKAENFLPGAEFTLTGNSKQTVLGTKTYYELNENGTYYLLKDGTYTTTAPQAEEKDDAGNVTVKSNEDLYVSTTIKYAQKTEQTTQEVTTPVKMVVTSGEDGKVVFEGLGEGTYTIEETKVPKGYNKCANIVIQITCTKPATVTTGTEKVTWTVGSATNPADRVSVDNPLGAYKTDIINQSGTTLPSTGGIGTTIFYIVGAILVVGAAILLVTKKRMSKEA